MGDLTVTTERRGAPYPTPARIGRPPKYTAELGQAIADALARGGTRTAAAAAHGVNPDTLRMWMIERDDFSGMVARAEALAELALTETVFAGGTDGKTDGDWRPAVEWLKRRRRADYGDSIDIRRIDTAQLIQLLSVAQGAIEDVSEPALLTEEDVR